MMEVADSHMLEQSSTFTPASHADIDMSAEYYDEEYMMHDAHPTTEHVDDEEIYDAETEEQTGHTEVEMDDYTDQFVDDNEAQMGTYTSADETTADVIVEDVHLASSPVASATPRAISPQPDVARTISQHVVEAADPLINTSAPTEPLSSYSPQSAATLVDGPEPNTLNHGEEKSDHTLREVIDLTTNNDEPPPTANNSIVDLTTNDGDQDDSDPAYVDLYEGEEEEEATTVTGSPEHLPPVTDEPGHEENHADTAAANDISENLATTVQDSEPTEQYGQLNETVNSPIEDALVLNQQVRDDAADTMEPSPPVRVVYDSKGSGISQTFDIFAPVDPSSSNDVDVLFADNRTLFYDPLSVFFARLRETEHFSGGDWQDAEIGLTMDLGSHQLTITEDHKQTDEISLFKLYFIWSGLGLEIPLQLALQRLPNRFSVQYARIVGRLEQKDIHGEVLEDLHEVHQREDKTTEPHYEASHHEVEDDPATSSEAPQQASPLPGGDLDAHASSEGEGDHEENVVPEAYHDASAGEFLDAGGQQAVGYTYDEGNDGDGPLSKPHSSNEDQHPETTETNAQSGATPFPPPVGDLDHRDSPRDHEGDGDLYDEYEDYAGDGDPAECTIAEQGKPVPASDKEYDEYEETEDIGHASDVKTAAKQTEVEDDNSDDYYDDYDDSNEEGNDEPASRSSQTSVNPQQTEPSIRVANLPSSPKHPLKRNLDDLENDDQPKPGLPNGAAVVDTKRSKHV